MPNAWVEFVRQYAKENNLSYGCAIRLYSTGLENS